MPGKPKRKSLDTNIVVAIIGVVGTIIAALITILPNRNQDPIVTQPSTLGAGVAETSAPASTESDAEATDVPTATLVPENTIAPTLAVGEDWDQNCISAAWQAYPSASSANVSDGCYANLFNSAFSAQGGHLTLSVDKRVESREVSGIFAEIPSNSIITINVHLNELRTSEIWVGVFDLPDVESNGYVISLQGSAKQGTFFALGMPTGQNLYKSSAIAKDSGNYSISLDITPNSVFGLLEQYTKINSFSLPSEKKWLFLGYRALTSGGNRIEGYFSDLNIESR